MSLVVMTCLDCGARTSAETTDETSAWSAAHELSCSRTSRTGAEMPDEGSVMSALDHARDVLREWESGDRYYPGSEDRLYSALHGLVAARGAAEALPPAPGPCPAEAYSWDFYRPEQTDPYWMRCRKSEGHDGEHQSDEGAQWSGPNDPS